MINKLNVLSMSLKLERMKNKGECRTSIFEYIYNFVVIIIA